MGKNKITRRGFIKIAGATGVASSELMGFSLPFGKENREDKIIKYEQGKKVNTFCEMCFWKCGINAFVKDGKIRKLEGNKKHPNNYGKICAKGNAGIYSTYDVDRVQYPLLRIGNRGEGKWKRISWDEAYKIVHQKLGKIFDEYGKKSLATFIHGTGEIHFHNLTYALGSPNVAVPSYSQCVGSREIGFSKTFGFGVSGHEIYDFENTKHILSFGRNLLGALQIGEVSGVIEGISNGAKFTYVDPRCSESVSLASNWLKINPGTDLALILSLMHVIIRDNLANYDFIREYCYGFNELREHVKQYSPEWAEEKTGIKANEIESLAWEFAKDAPNVVAVAPRRISRYGNDVQFARSIAMLNALMGNVGMPGGLAMRAKPSIEKPKILHVPCPEGIRADGAGDKFPFAPKNLGITRALYDATLSEKPYPIKAWMLYDCNPLGHTSIENGNFFETMEKVEFIVSIDTQMNDSSYWADLVLPESTYLERYDYPMFAKDKVPYVALRNAAIRPIYDTKSAFEIAQGIAKEFGVENYFQKSPEEITKEFIQSLNKEQRDEINENGVLAFYENSNMYPQAKGDRLVFNTTTGKVQFKVPEFDEIAKIKGDKYAGMPIYKDPKKPKKNEMRLLTGRVPNHSHARTQNNWMLMELDSNNPVWVNTKDAIKLGFKKGDKVILKNVTTGCKSDSQDILITDKIKENVLFASHGFGHISKSLSVGYNKGIAEQNFCSYDIDPLSGACGFNNGFVTIEKA